MNGVQARGRKGHAKQTKQTHASHLDVDAVGQGLFLIGDLGLENHKSGSQIFKQRHNGKDVQMDLTLRVGYSNISLIGSFMRLQQDSADGPATS